MKHTDLYVINQIKGPCFHIKEVTCDDCRQDSIISGKTFTTNNTLKLY